MADINGVVSIGDIPAPIPGEAVVLLLDVTLENVVDSTVSDPVFGEYTFTGLPAATTYFILVKGDGVLRSRLHGPVTTP